MRHEPDNARAEASRSLLTNKEKISLSDIAKFAFGTRVLEAEWLIPLIKNEWLRLRKMNPNRAQIVARAVALLDDWDCLSSTSSPAMTLFIFWSEYYRRADMPVAKKWRATAALEAALTHLQQQWGRWWVPWGAINRLQRRSTVSSEFCDAGFSVPIAGGPSWTGMLFAFEAIPATGSRRRYGIQGNSVVCVAEFGQKLRVASVSAFGQCADPASKHFLDQAKLYAQGKFKRIWLELRDIKRHSYCAYQPGEEPTLPDEI